MATVEAMNFLFQTAMEMEGLGGSEFHGRVSGAGNRVAQRPVPFELSFLDPMMKLWGRHGEIRNRGYLRRPKCSNQNSHAKRFASLRKIAIQGQPRGSTENWIRLRA